MALKQEDGKSIGQSFEGAANGKAELAARVEQWVTETQTRMAGEIESLERVERAMASLVETKRKLGI